VNKSWLLRRIFSSLAVLAAVLVLNFLLFRIMPGDAVSTIIDPNFSPEAKNRLRALYGLDRPLIEQFFIYIKQMLTFRFGLSFLSRKPVWDELMSRLPGTLALMSSSMLLSSVIGIWLGVKASLNRGRSCVQEQLLRRFPAFLSSLSFLCCLRAHFRYSPCAGACPSLSLREHQRLSSTIYGI